MSHELHHYYTDKLLGRDAVFNADFMLNVIKTGNKIELNRVITETDAKKLGDATLTGKNMTLSQSVKLR